jgi:hypothetical protein
MEPNQTEEFVDHALGIAPGDSLSDALEEADRHHRPLPLRHMEPRVPFLPPLLFSSAFPFPFPSSPPGPSYRPRALMASHRATQ